MPETCTPDPMRNRLLALLAEDASDVVSKQLESVRLTLGDVLFEPGARVPWVYFPTDGMVSMQFVMSDGATAQIAVVGNEGIAGLPALLGGGSSPSRTTVHVTGHAFRVPGHVVAQEFRRGGTLMLVMLRFLQCLATQMAQTAVCNRHHVVEQQLCRWLLMCLDRIGERRLALTQGLIATMLGVRREGITASAQKLQTAGIIRYSRGLIEVLDRPRLEQRACECYTVVRAEYERLLPGAPPAIRGVA